MWNGIIYQSSVDSLKMKILTESNVVENHKFRCNKYDLNYSRGQCLFLLSASLLETEKRNLFGYEFNGMFRSINKHVLFAVLIPWEGGLKKGFFNKTRAYVCKHYNQDKSEERFHSDSCSENFLLGFFRMFEEEDFLSEQLTKWLSDL